MGGELTQQLMGFLSQSKEAAWVKNSEVEEEGPKNPGFNALFLHLWLIFPTFSEICIAYVGLSKKWSLSQRTDGDATSQNSDFDVKHGTLTA